MDLVPQTIRAALAAMLVPLGCGTDVSEAQSDPLPDDDTSTGDGDETVTPGATSVPTTDTSTGSTGGDPMTDAAAATDSGNTSSTEAGTSSSTTADTSTSGGDTSGPIGTTTTNGGGELGTTSTGELGTSSSDVESSTGDMPEDPLVDEDFEGPDGAPWPAPWAAISQGVVADLVGGTGRLSGSTGYTARMLLPGFDLVDVDATIIVMFEDATNQGIGLYARQNGGALLETVPPGEGYAAYIEGEGVQTLGVWREIGGVEQTVATIADPIQGGILPAVPYMLRLQIVQAGPVTQLRTKIWPADELEPQAWMVDVQDGSPSLQDVGGTFAVDIYNYNGTGNIYVDDLVVTAP